MMPVPKLKKKNNPLAGKSPDSLAFALGWNTVSIPGGDFGEGDASKRKESTPLIFKSADGRYRWVAISSNAYQDRDGEIVSQKALEADVARTDQTGDYGPLRWWHTPGVELGSTDFAALHGKMLIESGTFYDERVAEKMAEHAEDLQISIGFTHPADEPDRDGVYHHITRFERSLVPKGRAANSLTSFSLGKETIMQKEKEEKLRGLLGTLADVVLGKATEKDATAEGEGVAFKEVDAQPAAETEKAKRKPAPMLEEEEADDEYTEEEDEDGEIEIELKKGGKRSMKESELGALIGEVVAEAMKPYAEQLAAVTTTKDAEKAQLQERLDATESALRMVAEQVKELRGEQPRANIYRASQSGPEPRETLKSAQPTSDPLAKFMAGFGG